MINTPENKDGRAQEKESKPSGQLFLLLLKTDKSLESKGDSITTDKSNNNY